jgi:putative methylase
MVMSKSQLAILLSKLSVFDSPEADKEQYPTDSEIAAEVLWSAYLLKDIDKKNIADFGSGTGILGIGALVLGAEKLFFVEEHKNSMKLSKDNLFFAEEQAKKDLVKKAVFLNERIENFKENVDVIIQNPPFGTKKKHADKIFLEKAFNKANVIYSFHKLETSIFIEKISEDYGFEITHKWDFSFPLKASQRFHKRRIHRIKVSCFRMQIK